MDNPQEFTQERMQAGLGIFKDSQYLLGEATAYLKSFND